MGDASTSIHIERVAPATVPDTASSILSAAWRPPCLHYTPAYLAWQLSFPGPPDPVAFLARDGRESVGLAAATPRRVVFGTTPRSVQIVTFVAVRPAWQGRGVAARLYSALLETVRAEGSPIVTFAQPDSAGDKALLRAYPEAGFELRRLTSPAVHAYRSRPHPEGGAFVVKVEEPSIEDPSAGSRDRLLHAAPHQSELEHLGRDPRSRAFLGVRSASGDLLARAWVVRAEMATPSGFEAAPILEGLTLLRPDAQALRALLEGAAALWPAAEARSVTVASLANIDAALIRLAGLRSIAVGFASYVAAANAADPLLSSTSTDLPVT